MSEHPAAAGVAHPPDPVVEVAHATKRYPGGVEALAGVDLVVARAESGPSPAPRGAASRPCSIWWRRSTCRPPARSLSMDAT